MKSQKFSGYIRVAAVFLFLLASPVIAAEEIGAIRSFRVNPEFDVDKRTNITATLRHTGTRAYYFVDDKFWNGLSSQNQKDEAISRIRFLASEFDNTIYPKETAVWGSEPNPGIDGDSRIYILLESLSQGSGGYFETVNGFTKEQAPESNVHEMIIINSDVADNVLIKNFLAHEFHHLISFQQKELLRKVSEETWLNELRAEYSPAIAGYAEPYNGSGLERRATAFVQNPTDSLTEWPNEVQDYAPAALFAHYMTGRYGTGILSDTLKSNLTGIASIDGFLSSRARRFYNLFADWLVANYINDRTDTRYGYVHPGLAGIHVGPTYQSNLFSGSNLQINYSLKGWQPLWHEFRPGVVLEDESAVKIYFNGEAGRSFPFAVVAFLSDGSYRVHNSSPVNGQLSFYITNPDDSDAKVTKILLALTHDPGVLPGGTYVAVNLSGAVSLVSKEDVAIALANPTHTVAVLGTQAVEDGALIKRNNAETEMYVITGNYKRFLRPEIISLYGHLNPANVIPVPPVVFDKYAIANYVRVEGDKKVWVIWPDGTRHWLNISGEQFTATGRDWNAIFTINPAELNAYRVGADIVH